MDDRSGMVSGTQEPDATVAATSTAAKSGFVSRRARRRNAVVTPVPDDTSVTDDASDGDAVVADLHDDAVSDEPGRDVAADPAAFATQRRKSVIKVVIGAIVVAFLGWLIGSQIQSPADVAARSQPPTPTPIFQPVTKQQLSTVVRARGTGGFGSPRPVTVAGSNLSAGTVITGLAAPNSVIPEGGVLAQISGRPVLALQGEAPMYRDMGPGMSGSDVAQLETALLRIGLNPGNVDGLYDGGTEAAVRALYNNAGFQPIVANLVQLDAVRAQCPTTPGACPNPGVQVPASEVFFVAGAPVQVNEVTAQVGGDASGPLMNVSDSNPRVTGQVRLKEAKSIEPGMDVRIDQADLGIRAKGKVTAVAERPGPPATDGLHVAFETSVEGAEQLNGVSVRVVIPINTTKDKKLTVPVSAVVHRRDGTDQVQVLTKDGLQWVEVDLGLSADGIVAVTPVKDNALEEGDKVVVGFRKPGG